jgi:isopenicillin N synthase-like dioxygenase
MSNNNDFSKLETDGFVAMPYLRNVREGVIETARYWEAFCALPLEVRQKFVYSNDSAGVGWELKDGQGNKADHKENFDITVGAGLEYVRSLAAQVNHPDAINFIESAARLVDLIEDPILDFARQVESEFGVEGLHAEVAKGKDRSFIRFIHYFPGAHAGDEIASAHPDQSGFTPHLYESAPGLQCLTRDGRWIDMPVSESEMVVIPSMQLQLRSHGRLKATYHRVVATAETALKGRSSAVCFRQLGDTPKYDKATHGRLQEKREGFNYNMPDEEFAKLFK